MLNLKEAERSLSQDDIFKAIADEFYSKNPPWFRDKVKDNVSKGTCKVEKVRPFTLHRNCVALPHCIALHRNCGITALQCGMTVRFILT